MTTPQPPVAKKVPTERTHHGDTFVDNYEWLREKESPEVVAHLTAENEYTAAVTADQEELRNRIFEEIRNRTEETDLSVPARKKGWWYYTRTEEGKQYAIHCRTAARDTGDLAADWTPPSVLPGVPVEGEQILIDGNAEAEGKPFFSLGGLAVTEDGHLLAYSEDNAGDERFTLRIKDLRTGDLLPDSIPNVFYSLAFSPDGNRVFYTVVDDSWRPYQVKAHTLGTPVEDDVVIYQEDDIAMWTGFDLSADRRQLLIGISSSEYSEYRVLDFDDPADTVRVLIPRSERILYEAEPLTVDGRRQYLLTHNHGALNSMLSLVAEEEFAKPLADQHWQTVIAHDDTVRVNGAAVTRTHVLVSVRKDTTERVQILPLEGLGTPAQAPAVEPAFDEELYTANLANAEFDSPIIRLSYTSFLTPPRVYDYVLSTGDLELRKQTPVKGGYRSEDYVAEREWATAADGTRIPLSVIRRADLRRDGSNPALVYAYGSYEVSMDPGFNVARLSLLDRGVVYVVAHIRGGGEMGRAWYDDGKKLNKKNTFTDFVDATDWVAASGWADPGRIAAMGGSAGGLLMGAVANLAPEKYRAIVAQVPFVDALTSILDPDLPLSALEWEEWGNPITDPEVYRYMKEYTPYENIRAVDYPKIAAVTSFNDTRVLYVEPAKWVAQLRETSTGSEPIVLKIEMDGGHGGASGRYEAWKDRAWDYAFILAALGARDLLPAAAREDAA
ncbi:S9 family peptidase [Arthrobacter zhangbolii]|uniref:S9 family peptidase n=1 Tax=Arthrobacter zhangbolii TaxID=2886936 RepID=A0A9X1S9R2_9MICC|nr:S9 family peptidase [Arthrobacter zhangbolii]MCC3272562.1 S9 family peptidase [Arthrobacter zhangbolii]UON91588.1 S9 family peptidase [Arthrobacter zhangbolii]